MLLPDNAGCLYIPVWISVECSPIHGAGSDTSQLQKKCAFHVLIIILLMEKYITCSLLLKIARTNENITNDIINCKRAG